MPRRNSPAKRITPPDNKYNNLHVAMIINRMMRGGKKSIAQGIMYGALDLIEERLKRNPIDVMEQSLRNVAPAIEVKPMRVGGATYQVPVEVPTERGTTLAMRWILENSRKRGGRSMAEKLAGELMDAFNGQGASVKKKDDTHRMAEANRAFAHFR
ncbi:MAG: 30S ribosomal protein S7 [Anaerolineae bacterium]|jgi:small subunit ribosomal protein S7|uniref:30S ribosomal protein S7 n=1 Tax=Candidatus Flexifilum breve TaxID=3140694 RepID=UPI001AC250BC|nr:30S ribosomal protein S7 [Chloroflexota bacterium]MBN8634486.1 30S ribosomal protein S7 [Anaerolineae bacterium]